MTTQFFLDETDIDTLINLLLRSQQSRTREALCYNIGIDPKRLSFIRDSSEYDFFLLLIKYLNEIGEEEALCKLCCKELFPVFSQGKYATILSEIAAKLNCDQNFSNINSNSSKNQNLTVVLTNGSIFSKGISIIAAVTGVMICFYYFTSQPQPLPSGTYQHTCKNISVKDSILTATCGDGRGQDKTSSLAYKQCIYGIENSWGRLECKQ
ncbi:hypothetical protein WA1_19875 [Scytonema hofmannii PCC 7110]|uniref:Uncharacterized protein n=1 Tax=Scytonema hofmannii PCC 7110 TaxID=128403 RepID=A0A139XC20_9CYAN|nr:hypothetical protein [Scytonema hofmannii]KYC42241.1 hypothetical protein WA1_19875 [Scytonema hofmannii PCC 7110]